MKMTKTDYVFTIFIHLILTMLLIYDFFPNSINYINIPKGILVILILIIFLLGVFFGRKNKNNKTNFFVGVVSILYILLIFLVLTLLGGVSQVGISITSPWTWIIFAFALLELFRRNKKTLKDS